MLSLGLATGNGQRASCLLSSKRKERSCRGELAAVPSARLPSSFRRGDGLVQARDQPREGCMLR